MDIQSIDYVSTALSRITQQYRNKPRFVELVGEYASLVKEYLEEPASKLFDILDIDIMEGHNLDVIGDIVGQPRVLVDYDLLTFFGFDGAPASGTFGDVNNAATGERFVSAFEDPAGEKTLSDPEYRVFIKAKILKNYSDSTEEDLAESIKLILGADQVKINESTMSLDIGILGSINDNDLALIQNYDIIPRPTGVEIASVYEYGLLEFNGTSTKIDFASTTDFDIGSSDFEIRFKTYTKDQNFVVLSKEDATNHVTPSYMARVVSGYVQFVYSSADTVEHVIDSGLFVSDGLVHSVIIKRQASLLLIIVDGNIYLSSILSDPFTGTSDFFKIGYSHFFNNANAIRPTTINVINAGTTDINGSYSWTGLQYDKDSLTALYLDPADLGGDGWLFQETVLPPPVFEQYRRYITGLPVENSEYPPRYGFIANDGGLNPPPTLIYTIDYEYYSGLIFDASITIGGVQKGKWLLTEGTGTTANDTSGNGNNGTITDGTWVTSLS